MLKETDENVNNMFNLIYQNIDTQNIINKYKKLLKYIYILFLTNPLKSSVYFKIMVHLNVLSQWVYHYFDLSINTQGGIPNIVNIIPIL